MGESEEVKDTSKESLADYRLGAAAMGRWL